MRSWGYTRRAGPCPSFPRPIASRGPEAVLSAALGRRRSTAGGGFYRQFAHYLKPPNERVVGCSQPFPTGPEASRCNASGSVGRWRAILPLLTSLRGRVPNRARRSLPDMRRSPPQALQALLQADDDAAREHAWDDFIAEFSRLILHVTRSQTDSYDVAMDRYSFVLERLREGDFRRLRTYAADGRGKFSTWLVVVVRRLCADEARRRYGRDRGTSTDRRGRRDLVDLVGSEIDVNLLPDTAAALPSDAISAHELQEALAGDAPAAGRIRSAPSQAALPG
jgi:DNA-directed RNA polymerase specialized sigma24 family protein